jgi:ZF-HD class homeobox domain-containing protein
VSEAALIDVQQD